MKIGNVDTKDLALRFYLQSSNGYRHIVGDFMRFEIRDGERSLTGSGEDSLRNLFIWSQSHEPKEAMYGYQLQYRDVVACDIRELGRMHKTLGAIDRAMEKIYDTEGSVESMCDFVARVVRVTGITQFYLCEERHRREVNFLEIKAWIKNTEAQ